MLNAYLSFFSSPCKPDASSLIEVSQKLLSEKRFRHVQGVHRAALKFAGLFALDASDTKRLELAVWFHDFVKGLSIAEQKILAEHLQVELPEEAHKAPAVYHALIDAWLIPNIFGLKDSSIEAAVLHHTTGHPSLDILGQLLFLADYCEDGRGFDSSHITDLLPNNLEAALYQTIKEKIIHVLQKDSYLHSTSLAYYHYLLPNEPQ